MPALQRSTYFGWRNAMDVHGTPYTGIPVAAYLDPTDPKWHRGEVEAANGERYASDVRIGQKWKYMTTTAWRKIEDLHVVGREEDHRVSQLRSHIESALRDYDANSRREEADFSTLAAKRDKITRLRAVLLDVEGDPECLDMLDTGYFRTHDASPLAGTEDVAQSIEGFPIHKKLRRLFRQTDQTPLVRPRAQGFGTEYVKAAELVARLQRATEDVVHNSVSKANGRPPDHAKHTLMLQLAADYWKVRGAMPTSTEYSASCDRRNKSQFWFFVIAVFDAYGDPLKGTVNRRLLAHAIEELKKRLPST